MPIKYMETTEVNEGDLNYFAFLCKTNFFSFIKHFDLTLNKLKNCPDFLKPFYDIISNYNLLKNLRKGLI